MNGFTASMVTLLEVLKKAQVRVWGGSVLKVGAESISCSLHSSLGAVPWDLRQRTLSILRTEELFKAFKPNPVLTLMIKSRSQRR